MCSATLLGWFEALRKARRLLRGDLWRYLRGELTSGDVGTSRFETGVPLLAETAAAVMSQPE